MKKRVLAALLAGAMVLGTGVQAFADDAEKLVVAFRTFGTTPTDLALVEEKLSEITMEKIGVGVELLIIPSGSYKQQTTLMLSGDEKLDVMGANSAIVPSAVASEQLKPMGDLIEEYGQGIKEVLGEELLANGVFDGQQYCIPIKCDATQGMGGFMLRKDICDKYEINVEEIDTYEELSEAFAIVHENEPNMTILAPYSPGYSPLQFSRQWDKLGDDFGVLENMGQSLTVVNLFETDAYKDYLNVYREWYLNGYISEDVTNATEAGASLMKAGNLFAYTQAGKPGIETQEKNSSGYELFSRRG